MPTHTGRAVRLNRRAVLTAMLALASGAPAVTGASVARADAGAAGKVPVVASFSILADLAHQVGGDRVDVTALVGPGGDVHVFSPAPADAKRIAAARLIITNGLALEGWLPRLISASGAKAPVIVASKGVNAAHLDEKAPGHVHDAAPDHNHGHDHGGLDPHAWQDVANVKIYVRNIRDGLIAADPAGRDAYENNAAAYLARLDELDADIRRRMAAIPADHRRIITTHDAFGYFGRAYGLGLIAPQGLSTDTEASAADVARVVRQIRAEKAPAVFLENIADPRLMARIARETGVKTGGQLYTDSLSLPDGPAASYIDMMRSNVGTLEKALAP
ncbi:metal ABC transporter substrate-binding protein [Camelimonas fluminis]|uniref:Metal ABC transporter substrate-binding protein n=1 Tax=Camelimonas fluminis TaxID=1576911 RepID=A0ABV7UEP8_9HYPH|nr:metal ABC transporter substrate-binding protein [Camelimonas fluminis]GHE46148.1 metal ABC transporter substrate-binding protein [Camelimonas fluminis]